MQLRANFPFGSMHSSSLADDTSGDVKVADGGTHPCPGAIILGGDHGSLGVARSLGRKGIPVYFITDDKLNGKFSRYVIKSFSWAGPTSDDAVDYLLRLAETDRLAGWVLFPAGDREVTLVSQNHVRLSRVFRVCTMPWDTLRDATDKGRMYEQAERLGIGYPKSYHVRSKADLAHINCEFPVVLKPSVKMASNALTQDKAWKVDDAAALSSMYDKAVDLVGAESIIIQEMIPGLGETQFSYAGVWNDGAPVASMIARRTRQYPVEFGTGTFVETVDQPEVENIATRFLQSLTFSGIVEIEFKLDKRRGAYKILDVNPRVWTWNSLGHAAGVDFAYVQWLLATGQSVAAHRGVAGAAWIYASKDALAALRLARAGMLDLGEYFGSFRRRLEFAAFAADDLLPAVMDVPLALWWAFKKRLRRIKDYLKPMFLEPLEGAVGEINTTAVREKVIRGGLKTLYLSGMHSAMRPFCEGVGSILTFHRVRPTLRAPFQPNKGLEITPDFLVQVVQLLQDRGVDLVSLDELHRRLVEKDFARPFASLTFDDGYRDNKTYAYRILKKRNIPFTVYVPSDFMTGRGQLWWQWLESTVAGLDRIALKVDGGDVVLNSRTVAEKNAAYRAIYRWLLSLPTDDDIKNEMSRLVSRYHVDVGSRYEHDCMNWEELAELASDPLVTIGAHTVSHPVLAKLSEESARAEIEKGRSDIERRLGRAPSHFSYPFGDRTAAGAREYQIVKELGFKTGVTTRPGTLFDEHANHLASLPRLSINGNYQEQGFVDVLLSGAATAMWNRFRHVSVG
jgi:predicted ATP-grasp superfamily ATP-dependent carboligase/peptidoglycan/xylan/chitin deacetylase (PgdA/CDA1 family)